MEKIEFIIKTLDALSCPPLIVARACTKQLEEKSYQILKDNPNITLQEFYEKTGVRTDL